MTAEEEKFIIENTDKYGIEVCYKGEPHIISPFISVSTVKELMHDYATHVLNLVTEKEIEELADNITFEDVAWVSGAKWFKSETLKRL